MATCFYCGTEVSKENGRGHLCSAQGTAERTADGHVRCKDCGQVQADGGQCEQCGRHLFEHVEMCDCCGCTTGSCYCQCCCL
jgi:hypothetical protein